MNLKMSFLYKLQIRLKEMFYSAAESLPLKRVGISKKMIKEKSLYMKILQKKTI